MKRRRNRRLALALGVSVAFLVVAAVTAVALAGGVSGGGAPRQEAASSEMRSSEGGLGDAIPLPAGQPDADSDGGIRVSEGQKGRSVGAELGPEHRKVVRTNVAALERAAGLDPDKITRVPRIPYRVRVEQGEALPCTSPRQPINFQIFSAGPSVGGVRLNSVERGCGEATFADEQPANFVNYIYGHCEISEGADGCLPPLEIQTWPACQRALADYSYDGEPMSYRRLPTDDGAEAVEILLDGRVEVYTGESTVVIFSEDPAMTEKALTLLQSQERGQTPASQVGEIEAEPKHGLTPPAAGATEGELPCQS
jgi:hypothetical protein